MMKELDCITKYRCAMICRRAYHCAGTEDRLLTLFIAALMIAGDSFIRYGIGIALRNAEYI